MLKTKRAISFSVFTLILSLALCFITLPKEMGAGASTISTSYASGQTYGGDLLKVVENEELTWNLTVRNNINSTTQTVQATPTLFRGISYYPVFEQSKFLNLFDIDGYVYDSITTNLQKNSKGDFLAYWSESGQEKYLTINYVEAPETIAENEQLVNDGSDTTTEDEVIYYTLKMGNNVNTDTTDITAQQFSVDGETYLAVLQKDIDSTSTTSPFEIEGYEWLKSVKKPDFVLFHNATGAINHSDLNTQRYYYFPLLKLDSVYFVAQYRSTEYQATITVQYLSKAPETYSTYTFKQWKSDVLCGIDSKYIPFGYSVDETELVSGSWSWGSNKIEGEPLGKSIYPLSNITIKLNYKNRLSYNKDLIENCKLRIFCGNSFFGVFNIKTFNYSIETLGFEEEIPDTLTFNKCSENGFITYDKSFSINLLGISLDNLNYNAEASNGIRSENEVKSAKKLIDLNWADHPEQYEKLLRGEQITINALLPYMVTDENENYNDTDVAQKYDALAKITEQAKSIFTVDKNTKDTLIIIVSSLAGVLVLAVVTVLIIKAKRK